jgi:GTP-binding protein
MPQTKFVLGKALAAEPKPIVVINKIDKPGSRIKEVEDELADLSWNWLFDEDQLHYPIYYAIGRSGKAWQEAPADPETTEADLSVIFDAIINQVPAPSVELEKPFQMLVTALAHDSFKGKYAIGRINRGRIKPAEQVSLCKKDGTIVKAKVDSVYMSHGVSKSEVSEGIAGDIVRLTGIADAQIGETIADADNPEALPVIEVEAPTLRIYLGPNTSTFQGQEGEFNTFLSNLAKDCKKNSKQMLVCKLKKTESDSRFAGRGELTSCAC